MFVGKFVEANNKKLPIIFLLSWKDRLAAIKV